MINLHHPRIAVEKVDVSYVGEPVAIVRASFCAKINVCETLIYACLTCVDTPDGW